MKNMLSVRECVKRTKEEGLAVSEYALRKWLRNGEIPFIMTGNKALIFYPNLVRYLQGTELQ